MNKRLSFPGQGKFVIPRGYPGYRNLDGGDDVMNPPALPVLPIFPDFQSMSCNELQNAIAEYQVNAQSPLITGNSQDIKDMYLKAAADATLVFKAKGCTTAVKPNIGPMPADADPKNTGIVPPDKVNIRTAPVGSIVIAESNQSGSSAKTPTNSQTTRILVIAGIVCAIYLIAK